MIFFYLNKSNNYFSLISCILFFSYNSFCYFSSLSIYFCSYKFILYSLMSWTFFWSDPKASSFYLRFYWRILKEINYLELYLSSSSFCYFFTSSSRISSYARDISAKRPHPMVEFLSRSHTLFLSLRSIS